MWTDGWTGGYASLSIGMVRIQKYVAVNTFRFLLYETNEEHCFDLSNYRYNGEVKKYEETKLKAETNLTKAGETLRERQKTKALEIARLTAMLRKAEMNVSTLEAEIDQKVSNQQDDFY